jgi:hypothetical protein
MWDSKVISRNNELSFTLDMKSCHFTINQIDQRMRWKCYKNNNDLHENRWQIKNNDVG